MQHIVSGEKRKDRLQRKAEAELERILKGGSDSTADQKKHPRVVVRETTKTEKQLSYISDWEEFQARVEATVQDSTSKLQTLKLEELQQNSSEDENWATFKADFDSQEKQTKEGKSREEALVSLLNADQAEKEPGLEEEKFPENLNKVDDYHHSVTSDKLPSLPTDLLANQNLPPAFQQADSENWANFDAGFSEEQGTPGIIFVEDFNKSDYWGQSKTAEFTENWANFGEGSLQFRSINEINEPSLTVTSDSKLGVDINTSVENRATSSEPEGVNKSGPKRNTGFLNGSGSNGAFTVINHNVKLGHYLELVPTG
ncbi:unnamed protein product [Schistocephalus solidus]|uniref:Uncharacterized protein n=1 Tax=Schistocephalus solidus TaxID=70667 RepID=A0A3P7DP88_SCHSO|nr:unnamed protein product [Schistocephalus solidus]